MNVVKPTDKASVWAVSDLHAAQPDNRRRLAEIQPSNPGDLLIVAGDVAEQTATVVEILGELRRRFAQVVWVPGNHELFARSGDRSKGKAKYDELVQGCRSIGVHTPEDEYLRFGDVTIAALFTLYDYSFTTGGQSSTEALQSAYDAQRVMTDEAAIRPYVDIPAWCHERLVYTTRRLANVPGPTILINHWPLEQQLLAPLIWPEIGLWCGTKHTAGWARRFNARAVIYGHLHLPGTTLIDAIPHTEVSLGYPREWRSPLRAPRTWPVKVMEESS